MTEVAITLAGFIIVDTVLVIIEMGLLDPFLILTAKVSFAMLVMDGGAWLTLKAKDVVQKRARAIVSIAALVTVGAYVLAGLWMAVGI
jgi:cytochrome d ubiquinol oxidase subunit II